jgi:hypothetical protein
MLLRWPSKPKYSVLAEPAVLPDGRDRSAPEVVWLNYTGLGKPLCAAIKLFIVRPTNPSRTANGSHAEVRRPVGRHFRFRPKADANRRLPMCRYFGTLYLSDRNLRAQTKPSPPSKSPR